MSRVTFREIDVLPESIKKSPNTKLRSFSFICISSNTASTASESAAAIKLPRKGYGAMTHLET